MLSTLRGTGRNGHGPQDISPVTRPQAGVGKAVLGFTPLGSPMHLACSQSAEREQWPQTRMC